MTETPFNTATIDRLATQSKEPGWLTDLRHTGLAQYTKLPWPHSSDDIWRRFDVSLLDPLRGFMPTIPDLLQRVAVTDSDLARFTRPLGDEELLVRVNGSALTDHAPEGIVCSAVANTTGAHEASIRHAITSDGLTEAEQKLTSLNMAFHHEALAIQVPPGYASERPVRLVHVLSAGARQALFPLTVITVGEGSSITLIDEYISLPRDQTVLPGQ